MNARQMLDHVVNVLRMSVGDIEVADRKLPTRFPPIKQMLIYVLPFPKNLPTAREVVGKDVEDWGGGCTAFRASMDAFAARPPGAALPRHPAFGALSRRAWGVLAYRHVDHHFRQFGA